MTTRVKPFTCGDLREYVMDTGWRLFAELWETEDAAVLRQHATLFPNLIPGDAFPEYPDAILSFVIDRHRFAVISSQGEYLFFVDDPECAKELLLAVARHFNSLLRRVTSRGFFFFRLMP